MVPYTAVINSKKGGLNKGQSDVSHDPKMGKTDFEDTAPYPTAAPIMRRLERLYLKSNKDP